eukprot:2998365-Pleurochrysis_carterae.AAC.1
MEGVSTGVAQPTTRCPSLAGRVVEKVGYACTEATLATDGANAPTTAGGAAALKAGTAAGRARNACTGSADVGICRPGTAFGRALAANTGCVGVGV